MNKPHAIPFNPTILRYFIHPSISSTTFVTCLARAQPSVGQKPRWWCPMTNLTWKQIKSNLAALWRHLIWLQIWPPDGTICISYQRIIRESSENYQRVIKELSENHQRIIIESSENYQGIIRESEKSTESAESSNSANSAKSSESDLC